jgi:cation:H+ antiporter
LVYLFLGASLVVILIGAKFFTNGVEWLGVRLGLARGAVGSVLAAIGTALPETMIPLVAILMGHGQASQDIGVGAILGAPFMLGTVGFMLAGMMTILLIRRRRRAVLLPHPALVRRDLGFFLMAYSLAIGAAFLPQALRPVVVVLLLAAYIAFVARALSQGEKCGEGDDVGPLLAVPQMANPPLVLILLQVVFSFMVILGGAKVFVHGIGILAHTFGVAPFIFALLIAPIATEMPELFNSLIWIREGKDTLALGNITGAMVFQSSIVPAIGISFTAWQLTPAAFVSAALALTSAWIVFLTVRRRGYLYGPLLFLMGAGFYAFFVTMVISGAL